MNRRPTVRGDRGRMSRVPSGGPTLASLVTSRTWYWCSQADMGVQNTGGFATAWTDQSAAAKHWAEATNPPLIVAGGLDGQTSLRFDGTNDILTNSAALALPGTTPTWGFAVVKQVTWTLNDALFGSNAANANYQIRQTAVTPNLAILNVTAVAESTGATVGNWFMIEWYFSASTSDYLWIGATKNTGVSAGNNSTTGRAMGARNAGTGHGNFEIVAGGETAGEISAGERAALRAAILAKWPSVTVTS